MTQVTIVIATVCSQDRALSLLRTVKSILNQEDVDLNLVIVANGPKVDQKLLAKLIELSPSQIRGVVRPEGDFIAALQVGRSLSGTEFVGFIDDDDHLLPRALERRVKTLVGSPHAAVVSAGFREKVDRSYECFPKRISTEPAMGEQGILDLLRRPYMLSGCVALFRSGIVTAELIGKRLQHLEWTSLAFDILSAGHSIAFVTEPGYIKSDSEDSMSKSSDVVHYSRLGLETLLNRAASPKVRKLLRSKLASELHSEAELARKKKELGVARRAHLASLRLGGWRYLLFSRKLISLGLWQDSRWMPR